MDITLLGVAVVPVIILLFYIYRKDKTQKEPLGLLLRAFFLGSLSVIPAGLMEGVLQVFAPGDSYPVADGLFTGFVVAGVSEELWKLLLLTLAVWKSREFDEYFDGIVYATFVSLGFACVENIGYVFGQTGFDAAFSTGVMRGVLAVPAHFLFGVMMGYFFSLAKFDPPHRGRNLIKAFAVPALMHGTYDSLLMVSERVGTQEDLMITEGVLLIVFIIFDIKMWKWGIRRIKRLQEWSQEENFDREDPFRGFTWDV